MHSVIERFAIGLLAVAATALVACGGADDDGSTSEAAPTATQAGAAAPTQAAAAVATEVGVTVTEWELIPDESSVEPGEVTFAVTNDGTVPHDFVVIRTDTDPTELPVAAGQADESGLDLVGRLGEIEAGASGEITFTLAAGSYVLICNVPAHYGLGMSAAFTVE